MKEILTFNILTLKTISIIQYIYRQKIKNMKISTDTKILYQNARLNDDKHQT
jgi:hypothetical protein